MNPDRTAPKPAPPAVASARGVEVRVHWGASVLHVAHLTPPRSLHVGEAGEPPCDCLVPKALLGVRRAPLVLAGDGGEVRLVVLAGASGTIALPGREETSLRALLDEGRARPHREIRGAHEIALPPGARATITLGDLVFEVVHDPEGPVIARSLAGRGGALFHQALSLAAHAALLAAAAIAMPSLGQIPDDDVTADQLHVFNVALVPIASPDEDEAERQRVMDGDGSDRIREDSRCGDDGGRMGEATAAHGANRYGVEGPLDNADPHIGRDRYPDPPDARRIGLLNGGWGPSLTPIAPWGRDDSLGTDPSSARARMWGEEIGMALGSPDAGFGVDRSCRACGASGHGTAHVLGAPGGATGTETALMLALAIR